MSEPQDNQDAQDERPCLHCLIVELIDDFYGEYPISGGDPEAVDSNEIITAVAKTVAELTSRQDGAARQKMVEQLMCEILDYDTEFRQQDAAGTGGTELH